MRVLESKPARILIVDDEERNLRLLEALLVPQGYDIVPAPGGSEALAILDSERVDTVLLDVMMPHMSGLEVCRSIMQNPATAHIPVILVTALHEREDRLKGIKAGARDFLSKPIDPDELLLRVRNALLTKAQHDQIIADLNALKELEKLRDNLTHMIVHDMRSPLTGLLGMLQLYLTETEGTLTPTHERYLATATRSAETLRSMADTLLAVSKLEEGKMPLRIEQHNLQSVVNAGVETLGALASAGKVAVESQRAELNIQCDREIIERVVGNLVSNAIRYTPKGGRVDVRIAHTQSDLATVSVIDSGPGIPAEFLPIVFDKFSQVNLRKESNIRTTGLGLTFCKLAVEAHHGTIGVQSESGKGSTFWFSLPLNSTEQHA